MAVVDELLRIIEIVNMLRRFTKVRRAVRNGGTPRQSMRLEQLEDSMQRIIMQRMHAGNEHLRRHEEWAAAREIGGRRARGGRQRLLNELQGVFSNYPDVREILHLMEVVTL